jgi:poly-beta-1,6 N-acetyl-D-glucosamine export porin PgaA
VQNQAGNNKGSSVRFLLFLRRFSSLIIPTLVVGILINEVINTPIYTDRDLRVMREAAVAEAGRGQAATAVEKLRALSEIAPLDSLIWGDYLVVLVRANQASVALALFAANPQRALPAYALPELFAAAIALGEFPLARQLAVLEIAQTADSQQLAAERARALIKAGYIDPAAPAVVLPAEPLAADPSTAESLAAESLPAEPATVNAPLATEAPPAYTPAPAVTKTPQPVITATNPATQIATPNAQAPETLSAAARPQQQSAVDAPQAAPGVALTAAQPSPASVTAAPLPSPTVVAVAVDTNTVDVNTIAANTADSDARLLAAEQARVAVREAELAPAARRVQSAESALIALDAYAADLATHPASEIEVRNEKLDRVRALTLANRLEAATTLFEALGEPGLLPNFGLLYGADLYVRQDQPAEAQALLDIAEQQDPTDRNVLLTRFYLDLNAGDFAHAGQTLAQLRNTAASPLDTRNDRLLGAQLAAYSDQLEAAQLELEVMLAEESTSADIHQRLAQVYRWRGWPRRALTEYDKAKELAPEPESAQLAAVNTLVDMHNFSAARTTLAAVAENSPEHPELSAALLAQQQRDLWEYSTQFSAGGSSDSPVTGAGAFTLDQRLLSAPFADHVRAFAHQRYDWADYPEGSASLNRVGFGLDYRSPQLDAALELVARSQGSELGINLNAEWHFDDQFSLFGGLLTDNTGVPLRGLRADIDGDSYAVGLLHRANESRQTRLSYSLSELSDGNDRTGLSLRHTQSWFLSGRRRLSVIAEAYYGNNANTQDVAYFNPASEKVASATFEYTAPVWRDTERDWSQRIAIGSGVYHQELFGNSAIWDIEYEQRLRFESTFEIHYGLLYRNRVYDGKREGYGALIGGMNWRF